MTATCNVRRSLLGNEQLSVQVVQGQKHHDVSGSQRAEGRCHCVLCSSIYLCTFLTAWLLFMAGARATTGKRKGDRRALRLDYSLGDVFPPAAYRDDGTLCQKSHKKAASKSESQCPAVNSTSRGPGHSHPPGWLRLLGYVWFYSGQGQRRECVDSAPGGGIPDCAHAVEITSRLLGRPCTPLIYGETARAPSN